MARVHILGTGTPTPTKERFGSAFAVEVEDDVLMFDCGPAATHKLVKAGLWPTRVDYLFFTHHHFDHNVDYPCLLLCRWDQSIGRENPLTVYGPDKTEVITERLIGEEGAFYFDWYARIHAPASQRVYQNRGGVLPRRPPTEFVNAVDIGPGIVHTGKKWEVTAAPAEHVQPYLDSLAYRLDTPDGSVVFTGDTQPCESVIELARDADLLICMCWDDQARMEEMGEVRGHCGTVTAAEVAQEANVGKLVLVHSGPNLTGDPAIEKAISDARGVFGGEVIFAEELMAVDLEA